jgi:hypothetical protein
MTVRIEKPALNLREEINRLDKPTGIAGEAMLRAETPQEQFNLIGAGRRNLFMNGDFRISQRGTSHTYSNGQSGFHTLDRIYSVNFSSGTLALSQQHAGHDGVDAPKFLRATTASTVGASATVYSRQSIEGIELFSNKQVTVSFMVKSNASTTFQLRREYYYGSGGSTTEYSGFVDVPVTTSWTQFTHTYSAVDFSSKTIGSSNFYAVMFYWSTDQGSNKVRDGNIDITNVQIELGKVATPFEHRSYGEELALCHRYAYKYGGSSSDNYACGQGLYADGNEINFGPIPLPVPMRSTLSLTSYGTPVVKSNGTATTGFTVSLSNPDLQTPFVRMSKSGHGVASSPMVNLNFPSTSDYLIFHAEL